MKSKAERRQVFSLVFHHFNELTSLSHLHNRWISIDIWYDLLLQHTQIDSELIDCSRFKRSIKKSGHFSTFFNETNGNGFYFSEWFKIEGVKTQKYECILITTPGNLPPRQSSVHNSIITAIPPSWRTRTHSSNRIVTPPPLRSQPPPKRIRPSLQRNQAAQSTPIANDVTSFTQNDLTREELQKAEHQR